jgi:hypothetical protein
MAFFVAAFGAAGESAVGGCAQAHARPPPPPTSLTDTIFYGRPFIQNIPVNILLKLTGAGPTPSICFSVPFKAIIVLIMLRLRCRAAAAAATSANTDSSAPLGHAPDELDTGSS